MSDTPFAQRLRCLMGINRLTYREIGKALAAMMTEAQLDADWHYAKGVLTLGGNGPKVHFTGRTERDAAIAA